MMELSGVAMNGIMIVVPRTRKTADTAPPIGQKISGSETITEPGSHGRAVTLSAASTR